MTQRLTTVFRSFPVATAILLACSLNAHAALPDEIQVYADDINKPGEFGLELHVNTTPRGRKIADYPGEVVPYRGWRVTPEFSLGLTKTFEAGLYIPTNRDSGGRFDVAGAKLRLKWLPVGPNTRDNEETGGVFAGANLELSRLKGKFDQARTSSELRLMTGYRASDYLVAFNPVFGWAMSDGLSQKTPDFSFGIKTSRDIAHGIAAGVEYYSDVGTTKKILPWNQQANTLFLALDVDMKPWVFNIGIGRGLTAAADRVTVKAIFEFPL